MPIYSWLLLAGGLLYGLSALMILVRPKKDGWKSDVLMISIMSFAMLLILRTAFEPIIKETTLLYNIFGFVYFFSYILMPVVVYLYIKAIADFEARLPKCVGLIFLPSIIVSLLVLIFTLVYLDDISVTRYNDLFLFKVLDYMSVIPYLLFGFLTIRFFVGINEVLKKTKLSIIIILLTGTVTLGMILEILNYKVIASFFLIVLLLLFDFFIIHYPNIKQEFREAVAGEKHKKSHLQTVDIQLIKNTLNRLFCNEKIYLSDQLTLRLLADEVGVSIHQLSEYINFYHHMSFNHYVNKFRIEYAIILLEENPEQKILAVSFDSGFNSVSSFYRSFKDVTGVSPRDYLVQTSK